MNFIIITILSYFGLHYLGVDEMTSHGNGFVILLSVVAGVMGSIQVSVVNKAGSMWDKL